MSLNRFYTLLILMAFVSFYACESEDDSGGGVQPPPVEPDKGTLTKSINVDNRDREYILYVPQSYDHNTSTPLVFNFHGYTSNATEQMVYGNFRPIADSEGFLVVHPQGTVDSQGNTHFNVGWGSSTVNDVNFADALITEIAATYNIDATRIYSTGMSNGGFMSYHLACQLSNKIAAIASVTGSMSPNQFTSCNPNKAIPIMQIHGTEDGTVGYNGTPFISESIQSVVDFWVSNNNCDAMPSTTALADTNTDDGSTVEKIVYTNGTNGTNVELFKITGGGHTWPGTSVVFGSTNLDMDASQEIWDFFSLYDINGRR